MEELEFRCYSDCFGYSKNKGVFKCTALNIEFIKECETCKFYKSKKELNKGRSSVRERHKKIGFVKDDEVGKI